MPSVTKHCLSCNIPMIGQPDELLCPHCSIQFPGLVEAARKAVERDISRQEREIRRQQSICDRRAAIRSL